MWFIQANGEEVVKQSTAAGVGIEHDAYKYKVNPIGDGVRSSLAQDLT